METLKVDIQDDQQKRVLIAFLDGLKYEYRIEGVPDMVTEHSIDLEQRRADLLSGKASSLPWSENK
ncbi:hypothetical protein [Mucilaginibacter aquaedulcis]|jgi:hypothetical protein|uniref:hypothetical protein n=1 Tax=Mucilaginibacter aquaedulcis TaxID=1187081 RepID=UPI0025B59036|nr:hypothetical protein [Mucilaginibacter aquaedulcis]MDN3549064.1 hypothetical protein [Mucilaginibacter aquaedulcis]